MFFKEASLRISVRISLRNCLLTLAAVMTLMTGLTSACQAQNTKRLALLIGNDAYRNVEPLKNAKNDARLLAAVLKKANFEVTLVSDLDRGGFWNAVDTFKGRINKGDEVVFFFAGHGVQIGANQLLLPVEITNQSDKQIERDAIALVDVQDALRDARFAMLVIDACRDNPFPKQGERSIGATRGLLPPEPATGQVIVMSAGRNQKALDGVPGGTIKNGLFSWELAKVLQQPGLEVRNAMEQVKERVDDIAKRENHAQRPSIVNDLRGNFYFFGPTTVQVAPPATQAVMPTRARSAEEIEDAYWDGIKDSRSLAIFDDYFKAYANGRYAALAKMRQQKLREEAAQRALVNVPSAPSASSAAVGASLAAQPNITPSNTANTTSNTPSLRVAPPAALNLNPPLVSTASMPSPVGKLNGWPSQPISIVVPFPSGGLTDVIARTISPVMSRELGQPVVIINSAGAGSLIVASNVASAKPDGYTLLMATSAMVQAMAVEALGGSQAKFKLTDLRPLARLHYQPTVLLVKAESPWQNMQNFLGDVRRLPQNILFASSGNYGTSHLAMGVLSQALNLKLTHVPYKGTAPALSDLLNGHVSAMFTDPSSAMPYLKSGKLRALVHTGNARLGYLPELPSMKQAGLSGEFFSWSGLFMPAGTPEPIAQALRAAIQLAARDTKVREVIGQGMADSLGWYLDGAAFESAVSADASRQTELVYRLANDK